MDTLYDITYGGLSPAEEERIKAENKKLKPPTEPELLLHQNIPKPLHGIAPRKVLGSSWWRKTRHDAFEAYNWHCAACGVFVRDAKIKAWLEAHEIYDFDYNHGTLTYLRTVPLCHCCHAFVHNGRLKMLLDQKKIEPGHYHTVMKHGTDVLAAAGISKEPIPENPRKIPWKKWRMVIGGRRYGPSTNNRNQWNKGLWRRWKPDKEIKWPALIYGETEK